MNRLAQRFTGMRTATIWSAALQEGAGHTPIASFNANEFGSSGVRRDQRQRGLAAWLCLSRWAVISSTANERGFLGASGSSSQEQAGDEQRGQCRQHGGTGSVGRNTNRSSNAAFQPQQFTTYTRDGNAADDAMFRRYNRWWSRFDQPDPYDGSYDLSNPQSFNRYAYVQLGRQYGLSQKYSLLERPLEIPFLSVMPERPTLWSGLWEEEHLNRSSRKISCARSVRCSTNKQITTLRWDS